MFNRVIVVLVMLFSLSATAQSVKFDGNKVQNHYLPTSGQYDIFMQFTNKTGSPVRVVYNKLKVDWPMGWVVSFCDDINCHSTFIDHDSFQSIANNASSEFHVTAYPDGKADTGVIVYEIYPATNPAQRDTITVNAMVQWGVSTGTVQENAVKVYPNPATDVLAFNSALTGNCSVVTLQGASIMNAAVATGDNSLSISTLQAGVYILQVETTQGIVRKQFVKI